MNTKLFVGNLASQTTESDLQGAFAAFGTVTEANLLTDRFTGLSRGFGFVTMSSPQEAQKAIHALNGTQLGDRSITVNEARPRQEHTGSNFHSGRDRGTRTGHDPHD